MGAFNWLAGHRHNWPASLSIVVHCFKYTCIETLDILAILSSLSVRDVRFEWVREPNELSKVRKLAREFDSEAKVIKLVGFLFRLGLVFALNQSSNVDWIHAI